MRRCIVELTMFRPKDTTQVFPLIAIRAFPAVSVIPACSKDAAVHGMPVEADGEEHRTKVRERTGGCECIHLTARTTRSATGCPERSSSGRVSRPPGLLLEQLQVLSVPLLFQVPDGYEGAVPALLMQYRRPEGAGPSSNRWPRWAVAVAAAHLGSYHPQGTVRLFNDVLFHQGGG